METARGESTSLLARAALWKAAGRAWAYPSGDLLAILTDGLFERVVETAWASIGNPDGAAAQLGRALRSSLAAGISLPEEHTFLFSREVRCPPYQSSYSADPNSRIRNLSQLSMLLEGLGLKLSPETRDLLDHIGILMELIGHTQAREADLRGRGAPDAAMGWREVRRRLVAEHLGDWVEQFCARLKSAARLPFYPALGEFSLRLRNLEWEVLNR